jgi:hypothetical protein
VHHTIAVIGDARERIAPGEFADPPIDAGNARTRASRWPPNERTDPMTAGQESWKEMTTDEPVRSGDENSQRVLKVCLQRLRELTRGQIATAVRG